jgi:hypothetical protein
VNKFEENCNNNKNNSNDTIAVGLKKEEPTKKTH